jgi:general secretion pathway protein D
LSVTLDALKQVGRTNTLAHQRIRARSHEKAKILIGAREPVITNTVTPTAGGTPVVTGSVQYLDVGLTLEVEPVVHLDNEVSIKMMLEVSSILKQITTSSGTIAYEIGTRNAQTLLTLRDGETQILAGLIQDSDTRNSAHIPGLGDIPILGKLFGSEHRDKEKTEIVLSITPRIIRTTSHPSNTTTEFWYGTESNLRSSPLGSQASVGAANSDAPAGAAAAATQPAGIAPTATAVAPPGTTAVPSQVQGIALSTVTTSGATPAGPAPAQAPQVAAPPPPIAVPVAPPDPPPQPPRAKAQSEPSPDGPNVTWNGPSNAAVAQTFDVTVDLSAPQPLGKITSQLNFDGSILQLDGAEGGSMISADIRSVVTPKINQHAGVVQYVVAGTKESPIQGEGSFLVLHFKALGPAASTPVALQFVAAGVDGRSIRSGVPAPLAININP